MKGRPAEGPSAELLPKHTTLHYPRTVRSLRRSLLFLAILLGACGPRREETPPPTPLVEQMPPVDPAKAIEGTLLVAGMTCSGCEHNVTTALRLVPGVLEAEADHVSGETCVRFDPGMTTLAHLAEAVRTTGYAVSPTENVAPTETGD